MKTFVLILSLVMMTFLSCHEGDTESSKQKTDHLQLPKPPNANPTWVDSEQVNLKLNPNLKHNKSGFSADSVLLISYKGSSGEIIYELLNEEGKWLDSIYSVKKLSDDNIKKVHELLGSKTLTEADFQKCCFDPNFGIVFFKNGNVIAYSMLSIKDLKIHSTSLLGNGKHYATIDPSYTLTLNDLIKAYK